MISMLLLFKLYYYYLVLFHLLTNLFLDHVMYSPFLLMFVLVSLFVFLGVSLCICLSVYVLIFNDLQFGCILKGFVAQKYYNTFAKKYSIDCMPIN